MTSETTKTQSAANFSFLETNWPDLASLAAFAESYAHSDPPSAYVKIRIFAERIVDVLYYELGLAKPVDANFRDCLTNPAFKRGIPSQVIDFLHFIRKEGNKGAHESVSRNSTEACLSLLENLHRLSIWFYGTVTKQKIALTPYQRPAKPRSEADLAKEIDDRNKRIKELEEEQERLRNSDPKPAATPESLETSLSQGVEEANTIGLTEAETRKQLIDSLIRDAGWILLDKVSQYNPDSGKAQCIREYPVSHQPTRSGEGAVDYVFMGSNGKPVAVLEAKRIGETAGKGKTKAEIYANGLEKTTGQRPFIYYTNGHEIFFWDDLNYPPRQVWGFYDLEKFDYLLFQRDNKESLSSVSIDTAIAGRDYQLECLRRVFEAFENLNRRKALIVMATGTGKTRTATALVDVLMRAKWVKRVLFLVDRVELQTQAEEEGFQKYLPNETLGQITSRTRDAREPRIYTATYNSMMNAYTQFNVGFFDLVIADESHRSIYKYYREIFEYFDAYQIGLTATPVDFVARNTYSFFECPDRDPTFYYSLDEAINHKPPYLVTYQRNSDTTEFLQRGIKYQDLTEEQRRQLEEQDQDAQNFNYERDLVDKIVLNRETNRMLIRNLMDKGIRSADGTRPGKSIIFARSHAHGEVLLSVFDEMYPQYRSKIAKLIDYKDDRKVELIKGFKGKNKEFKDIDIAISVDMLDTGVDVPEVVNLVFAKPVFSRVKFWQMIGRGTRLCENLFGPGKDKTHFVIFDPWRNFEFFDQNPDGHIQNTDAKSVPERLFNFRLELLQALESLAEPPETFRNSLEKQIREDISALPKDSVSVRDSWENMERVGKDAFWTLHDDQFYTTLRTSISPLMRWRDIQGEGDAIGFDVKVTKLELALIRNDSDEFARLQDNVLDDIARLRTNLNQVKVELSFINEVRNSAWWSNPTLEKLEELRRRLRGLMKFRSAISTKTKIIDVIDFTIIGQQTNPVNEPGLTEYRTRVIEVLQDLVSTNLTLQKIRRGLPVTESDLESVSSLILERVPGLKIEELETLFPDRAKQLDKLIRSVVGMDELTVQMAFEKFRKSHTTLRANQLQFLALVEQEIVKGGGIEIAQLYQQPFTAVHNLGLEGVFPEQAEADELLSIITTLVG